MSNVVNDFHNFRAVSIYWMYFFEIYIDRNIVYLDQSTLRHQGQNRAFELAWLELLKNQEFQYHFSSVN